MKGSTVNNVGSIIRRDETDEAIFDLRFKGIEHYHHYTSIKETGAIMMITSTRRSRHWRGQSPRLDGALICFLEGLRTYQLTRQVSTPGKQMMEFIKRRANDH